MYLPPFQKTIKLEKPRSRNSRNYSGERHRFSFPFCACSDISGSMETDSAELNQQEKLLRE